MAAMEEIIDRLLLVVSESSVSGAASRCPKKRKSAPDGIR
jgi:hypothetical protein